MKYLSMKKSVILVIIGAFALSLGFLSSCVKKDFDTPPVVVPYVDFPSNITIKDLKTYYAMHKPTFGVDTLMIDTSLVIQGIVSATDESGNIYKNLYFQDSTGGIVITTDQTSLYTVYTIGQRIYVKLQGLYMGTYGGMLEIGYQVFGSGSSASIGRIPVALMSQHVYRDSLPGPAPAPKVLTAGTTADTSAFFANNICTLIECPHTVFANAGQPFVTGGVTTNRNLSDSNGRPIMVNNANFIIRTSNYASFSTQLLPFGAGNLYGILTQYSGQSQMAVRDMNDLKGYDNSWKTFYLQSFDENPTDPSAMMWTIYSVAGTKNWEWEAPTVSDMKINAYGGTGASDDWLITPKLTLTNLTNPTMNFSSYTKYTDSGMPKPLEVLVSTDYPGSGNPSPSATVHWTPMTANLPAANSASWTSSGNVDLSAWVNQNIYIAFHYKSSGTGSSSSSQWNVDDFQIICKK